MFSISLSSCNLANFRLSSAHSLITRADTRFTRTPLVGPWHVGAGWREGWRWTASTDCEGLRRSIRKVDPRPHPEIGMEVGWKMRVESLHCLARRAAPEACVPNIPLGAPKGVKSVWKERPSLDGLGERRPRCPATDTRAPCGSYAISVDLFPCVARSGRPGRA